MQRRSRRPRTVMTEGVHTPPPAVALPEQGAVQGAVMSRYVREASRLPPAFGLFRNQKTAYLFTLRNLQNPVPRTALRWISKTLPRLPGWWMRVGCEMTGACDSETADIPAGYWWGTEALSVGLMGAWVP
jgi:hypothetical protein